MDTYIVALVGVRIREGFIALGLQEVTVQVPAEVLQYHNSSVTIRHISPIYIHQYKKSIAQCVPRP